MKKTYCKRNRFFLKACFILTSLGVSQGTTASVFPMVCTTLGPPPHLEGSTNVAGDSQQLQNNRLEPVDWLGVAEKYRNNGEVIEALSAAHQAFFTAVIYADPMIQKNARELQKSLLAELLFSPSAFYPYNKAHLWFLKNQTPPPRFYSTNFRTPYSLSRCFNHAVNTYRKNKNALYKPIDQKSQLVTPSEISKQEEKKAEFYLKLSEIFKVNCNFSNSSCEDNDQSLGLVAARDALLIAIGLQNSRGKQKILNRVFYKLNHFADHFIHEGDNETLALEAFQLAASAKDQELIMVPATIQNLRESSIAHSRVGALLVRLKETEKAKSSYRKAVSKRETVLTFTKSNNNDISSLALSLLALSEIDEDNRCEILVKASVVVEGLNIKKILPHQAKSLSNIAANLDTCKRAKTN